MTVETYCREICKENFVNKDELMKALSDYETTVRADECRKFVEWLESQDYLTHIVYDEDEDLDGNYVYYEREESLNADEVLTEYENTKRSRRMNSSYIDWDVTKSNYMSDYQQGYVAGFSSAYKLVLCQDLEQIKMGDFSY